MLRLSKNLQLWDITSEFVRYNIKGKIIAYFDNFGPTGTKKDGVAEYLLDKMILSGEIKEGTPIVLPTTGNLAVSLAYYLHQYELHSELYAVMFDNNESLKRVLLKSKYPINVISVPRRNGEHYPKTECLNLVDELNGYFFNQYEDMRHLEYYRVIGENIARELSAKNLVVDTHISVNGTGATTRSINDSLKNENLQVELFVPQLSKFTEELFYLKGYNYNFIAPSKIENYIELDGLKFFDKKLWLTSLGQICTAIDYLKANPGKTVFTYLGD